MHGLIRHTTTLLAVPLLAFAGLTGCESTPKTTDHGKVFFPGAPAPPRLQYLTTFSSGDDVAGQTKSSLAQWVAGSDPQVKVSKAVQNPYGVAARDGVIYVCDVAADRVHVFDLPHKQYRILEPNDKIINPVNITIDRDGTKYLCDTGSRVVHIFDANDQYQGLFGDPGSLTPLDLAIGTDGLLYIADITGCEVEVWSKDGQFVRSIGKKGVGPDEFMGPTNLEFDASGRLYVTDTMQQIVKVFDTQGRFLGAIGGPGANIGRFARPKGIAVSPAGDVYVADSQWDTVQIFNQQGDLMLVFGSPGTEAHSMGLPAGIAIDTTSIPHIQQYLAPDFKAEYLLLVANQFGKNKIAIFAFGRDSSLPASAYEIDRAKVDTATKAAQAEAKLREQQRK